MPKQTTCEGLPITTLANVGKALGARLQARGVRTIEDLLLHLPLRFQDRTRVLSIAALRVGVEALFIGVVQQAHLRYGHHRRSLLVTVADGTGTITLRFFHFHKYITAKLVVGQRLLCFGAPRAGPTGIELPHPEYKLLADDALPLLETNLSAVYSAPAGISQYRIRALVEQALAYLQADRILPEILPPDLLSQLQLMDLKTALMQCHRPPREGAAAHSGAARKRLAFEELLAQRLSHRLLRRESDRDIAVAVTLPQPLIDTFIASLPFTLTAAQLRVCEDLLTDLSHSRPMHRLLQGDVGSGKTVVGAISALAVIGSGLQVAFMAPTELLAEQHTLTLSCWLQPLRITVAQLSRRSSKAQRKRVLEQLLSGELQLVIGTHALFQEQVAFARLGLIIIDEQHRFGVHQRLALNQKGHRDAHQPHQLVMTATPIPRTLSMTVFADLDTSIIDALPPGRKPIVTAVVSNQRRAQVIARIRTACQAGQQAYWVCTLIEESDILQCQTAIDTAEQLVGAFPECRIGLVHSRLPPAEKSATMQAFQDGKVDLLVATTVVEVGVDVPNASLMVIDNAERLGLAQLHQLRGRIGRGERPSACVLLYQPPLSDSARQRLQTIRRYHDGFRIAECDLQQRGAGELLGPRQTGIAQMKVADLCNDASLQPQVERAAAALAGDEATISALIKRWIGASDYSKV